MDIQQSKIAKWQRELMSFKGIKSTFIIEGNVNDEYFFENPDSGKVSFSNLDKTLERIFNPLDNEEDFEFVFFNPVFGFMGKDKSDLVTLYRKKAKKQQQDEQAIDKKATGETTAEMAEIIRAMISCPDSDLDSEPDHDSQPEKSIAVVVNFASRLITEPKHLNIAEITMFLNLLYASINPVRPQLNNDYKTLILVVDKLGDIPHWFYQNNPNVRVISIPNPDRTMREAFIGERFDDLSLDKEEMNDTRKEEISNIRRKFIDITEGMKLLELDILRRLYDRSNFPVEEITDTVSIYKFGFKESKWDTMREILPDDIAAELRKRVMGQEQALEKISQIIKRSVSGLSGLQHSTSDNKPRGIMFLAGSTGTGKTEVVKAVAELLFSDEKSMIRFDMSEYSSENADQKLFGAPPGYVGYAEGGQLTNAVKANPFSVLLFDEIEKAHPSIMDKFLQILEDGRMTDGQGNTVYFSETLIFFTSNAGISRVIYNEQGQIIGREMIVKPNDSYDKIQKSVEDALRKEFKPEVLNRIGRNIIVFNYISEEATGEILRKQLDNIKKGYIQKRRIEVQNDNSVIQCLIEKCFEEDTRMNGGRGIGNVVESDFINPLAVFCYTQKAGAGSIVSTSSENGKIVFELIGGSDE